MKLGDVIYYMVKSKVHSAPIVAVVVVENAHDNWAHTNEQLMTWQPFGPSGTRYATVHGVFDASQCFPTREALLASL